MNCKDCGRQIPDGALFCKYCGARVHSGEEDDQQGKKLDFEKSQKGVRRSSKKGGSGLIIGLVAVLIVAIGVLAAVLIWKNGTGTQNEDPQDPAITTQDQEEQTDEEWTASILPQDGEVEVGSNMMLNAAVDQELGSVTVRSVTWSTSDSKIATVSDGIVYGISEGTVTITAKLALSDGTSAESTAKVTVVEASVVYTAVISPDTASLQVGNSTTLVANLEQNLEEGVEVVSTVWSSDNKDVAVVSNGKVTAIGEGSATITVTINLSNAQAASANAKVTVKAKEQQPAQNNDNNNNANNNSNSNNGNTNNNGNNGTNNGGNGTSNNQGGGSYSTYNDYVLPGSNTSVYSYDVLRSLSAWELRVARNEIFARHGRLFDDAALQAHFNMKSWYKGTIPADQFNANVLNSVELENIARIKEVEASR